MGYLGHIVEAGVVKADPEKIQAMVDWPTLANLKQLRGFLGLMGYYRHFIRGCAGIAIPLIDLLRHDNFHWMPKAVAAFLELKQAMTSAIVLQLPNFDMEFIVEADASNVGLGTVLMQQNRPISFFSKKLSPLLTPKNFMLLWPQLRNGGNTCWVDSLLSELITRVLRSFFTK